MAKVSIKAAKNRLALLVRLVEKGERVVLTRNGKAIADMVPHRRTGGLNLDGACEFKRKHKIDKSFSYVADDFDAPLDEDFLIKPES